MLNSREDFFKLLLQVGAANATLVGRATAAPQLASRVPCSWFPIPSQHYSPFHLGNGSTSVRKTTPGEKPLHDAQIFSYSKLLIRVLAASTRTKQGKHEARFPIQSNDELVSSAILKD